MDVLFGTLAAVLWGSADFLARLAAERVGSRATSFWVQVLSGACLCAWLALAAPALPPAGAGTALGVAAAAGLLNAIAAASLYRALEIGTVSLVSPVASCYGAVTAALGIAGGERPTAAQLAGFALTLAGIGGVSFVPTPPAQRETGRRGLGLAVVAAASWGVGLFLLRPASATLGPVLPIAAVRLVSIAALGGASFAIDRTLGDPRPAALAIAGVAILDTGAFLAYEHGLAHGLTSVVAVLSSLFSVVTATLAFLVLRERLSPSQGLAVGVVLAGVGLVSSGAAP